MQAVEDSPPGRKSESTEHLNFIKDTHEIDIEELLLSMSEYDRLGTKINNLFGMLKENEWDKLPLSASPCRRSRLQEGKEDNQ